MSLLTRAPDFGMMQEHYNCPSVVVKSQRYALLEKTGPTNGDLFRTSMWFKSLVPSSTKSLRS